MLTLVVTHDREYQNTRIRRVAVLIFLAAITVATGLSAQDPGSDKDDKLQPRVVKLKTKDEVELRAFYFPSDQEKEAVTVLIIHEWKGQASPYLKLCAALQEAGCAVFVPDYRGHGGSRKYTDRQGESKRFSVERMNRRDAENIIALDLETTKGFLKQENNKGLLNLNALVVVGIREGATFAGHWAQRDWRFPSVGRVKQGQDVKALIYVSPERQIKGIGIDLTLSDQNLIQLPIMIIAGKDSNEAEEAERLAKRIEGTKKRIGRGKASGFKLQLLDTKLSGPSLVNDVADVIPAIIDFINTEVKVSEDENPWVERL